MPPGAGLTRLRADWKLFHHELNTADDAARLLPPAAAPRHHGRAAEPRARRRWRSRPSTAATRCSRALLRLLLRPSPARAATMLATIRSCLQKVDDRLADGRRYLNGDRFTLSDMAFAIAAAPVVWPDNYGGAVPALADTPPELQAVVAETRARPSGAHALRIYREHRDGRGLPTVTTTTSSTEQGALDGVHRQLRHLPRRPRGGAEPRRAALHPPAPVHLQHRQPGARGEPWPSVRDDRRPSRRARAPEPADRARAGPSRRRHQLPHRVRVPARRAARST